MNRSVLWAWGNIFDICFVFTVSVQSFVWFWFHLSDVRSGVARRGRVGACVLGRRPWARNSTVFAVILNVFLSKNFDQSMLINAYLLEKTVKIVSALGAPSNTHLPQAAGGSAPRPPVLLLPSTITSLSNSLLVLNASYSAQKITKLTTANVLLLLLPHICTYVLIQTL